MKILSNELHSILFYCYRDIFWQQIISWRHLNKKNLSVCWFYSYICDEYVINDNAAGDLKIIRSALSAIATQTFSDVESKGFKLLRSYSHTAVTSTYVRHCVCV